MVKLSLRGRRVSAVGVVLAVVGLLMSLSPSTWTMSASELPTPIYTEDSRADETNALVAIEKLAVKGRAPRTGYERAQFGSGWARQSGCDMRNTILARDLSQVEAGEACRVESGQLQDPYTGREIQFEHGTDSSQAVQIDHVVALSNAWQTGAQQLAQQKRVEFANDPLNLLAVDGAANQAKGDGDAATWLPPHKAFRCQYVARQVAVKLRYDLWLVPSEKEAIKRVLAQCPDQSLPVGSVGLESRRLDSGSPSGV